VSCGNALTGWPLALLHTEEVTGSIPVSPTMPKGPLTCGSGGLSVFFGAYEVTRPRATRNAAGSNILYPGKVVP
jgi:hypothetical protein